MSTHTQTNDVIVEPNLAQPYKSQWTPRRRELLLWFQKEAASLAQPYEAVIEILGMPKMPAKVHLIGHIVRDIYNKLPEILDGGFRHKPPGGVYPSFVKKIASQWDHSLHFDADCSPEVSPVGIDKISISVAAFNSVGRLVNKYNEMSTQSKSMDVLARSLYRQSTEMHLKPPHRLVEKFEEERKWFTSRAHLEIDLSMVKSEEGLIEHFTSFESALYSLVGQYFEGKNEIDEILQLNNKQELPSEKDVDKIVPWLTALYHERYFFRALDNPRWITPLKKHDLFKYSPKVHKEDNGSVICQQWPQSQYLARMASKSPEEVADILYKVETDNWTIARDVIRAAKEMPAKQAAKLAPKIGDLVVELNMFYELINIGEIIAKLAKDKEEDVAMQLASKVFAIKSRDNTTGRSRREYAYLKGLKNSVVKELIPKRASELLCLLAKSLKAASLEENTHLVGEDDYSYVWRPAIEDHKQNSDYSFAAKLVSCVRDAFELAIRENYMDFKEAIQILEDHESVLLKRLRLHLIAEFANKNIELAHQTMFDKKLFDDFPYKHEYARLMGMNFQLLTKEQQSEWLSWIDEGPEAIDSDYFDGTEDAKRRKHKVEYWKYQRLFWIRDHLTGDRAKFYQRMLEEKGKPELADMNVYSGEGRWGHESPYSSEELAKMGFELALTTVNDWHPKERSFDEPTHEGLASNFRKYVASDPVAFSKKATLLIDKQSIYVSNYLRSMEVAVKENKLIDLERVVDLCKWVIDQKVDDDPSLGTEASPMLVHEWEWSRHTIAHLVQAVCQAKDDDQPIYNISLREEIWSIIKQLSDDPTKSNIIRKDAEDPRITDWPSHALNSARGSALRAVFDYANWVADHIVEDRKNQKVFPGGFENLKEVRDLLAEQLTRPDDYFTARAIFGWRLGLLYWLDKKWLEDNADKIFDLRTFEQDSSKAYGWAAWTTFLYACRPHVEFYRILKDQFSYAVDQAHSIVPTQNDRERPFNHLGEHLIALLGRGDLGEDPEEAWNADNGIIKRLVTKSHPSVRSHAMEFIGRTMPQDGGEVPEDAIARFKYLWEQYWEAVGKIDAEENKSSYVFGQWFSSGAFGDQWSIEYLEKFVEAAPKAEPEDAIMDRLVISCEVDPLRSARIVGLMVDGDDEGWRVDGWMQEAKKILSIAMKAGGKSKAEAEQVIDRLGRKGYLEFGELLKMTTKAG